MAGSGDKEYMDDLDEYNINQEKFVHSSHSGKGRSKKEAGQHTNHADPGGHTRKAVVKLVNNSHKPQQSGPATKGPDSAKKWNEGD